MYAIPELSNTASWWYKFPQILLFYFSAKKILLHRISNSNVKLFIYFPFMESEFMFHPFNSKSCFLIRLLVKLLYLRLNKKNQIGFQKWIQTWQLCFVHSWKEEEEGKECCLRIWKSIYGLAIILYIVQMKLLFWVTATDHTSLNNQNSDGLIQFNH